MNRPLSIAAAAVGALALALAAPAAASAHVTVAPDTASAGSYALVNIKVPNESATAVTIKIEVSLPTETPFASVSYVPVPGWTTKLVSETLPSAVTEGNNTITEAVTKVIWTANPGNEISDGQLRVFPLSLGPVPDVGSIVLPAEQTYSDGTVVSWAETGPDAEHPAPVIYINDAPPSGHGGGDSAVSGTDAIARAIGAGGLVIGAVALVVAITALRRKAAGSKAVD